MSQSNESENNPELEVTKGLPQSPDDFTQYLRSFRPRAAQVSDDEICSECSPETATTPILFPAHAATSQASNTQNSFLRMGVAWACGMVMGAAIMALLIREDQTSLANANKAENNGVASNVETPTDSKKESNSLKNSWEDTSTVNRASSDLGPLKSQYPVDLLESRSFESNLLVDSRIRFRLGMQDSRSAIQRDPYESFTSDIDDVSTNSATTKDHFKTPERKSDRRSLLREFLSETI
jgi:hypothetical protein